VEKSQLLKIKYTSNSNMALIGMPEIILIIAVFLLFFGSEKLPELAKSLGKAKKEFENEIKSDNVRYVSVKNII